MNSNQHRFILKLGGSLIIPAGKLDIPYISLFYRFIRKQVTEKGRSFFIQVGGGGLSRHYIEAGDKITEGRLLQNKLDWLGIYPTWLNARMFQCIFSDIAHSSIITNYKRTYKYLSPVVIASGWKPGCSTDNNAVLLACKYDIETVIKLSNTPYIYDKNPTTHSEAKPLERITWDYYQKHIAEKWSPGKHTPIDQPAAVLARNTNKKVIYVNGHDLDNLEKVFNNQPFTGTIVSSASVYLLTS